MIKSITLNGRKYLSNNATKINYRVIQTKLLTAPIYRPTLGSEVNSDNWNLFKIYGKCYLFYVKAPLVLKVFPFLS